MTSSQSLSERLRAIAAMNFRTGPILAHTLDTAREAADALDAQAARLAQAEAVLDEIIKWWGEDSAREEEPHFVTAAREALAAISANNHKPE